MKDPFAKWRLPDDPPDIMPEVLAARVLGIQYGDLGPKREEPYCPECWEERYVWLGNAWGISHKPPGLASCRHECHEDEVWMAGGRRATEALEGTL